MSNGGRICVSVCAETADELIEQINRAESLADVFEIRFDCLNENELNLADLEESGKIVKKILENVKKDFLLTFRPKEQGGKRDLSLSEREVFWNLVTNFFCGADFEEDFAKNHSERFHKPLICSHHDFKGVPENLNEIYERLKSVNGVDVVKIAVQTDDITDAISIWKLLDKAKKENRKIIPIAMGESGKWTRILSLAHGAFMTYASLDSGRETAPGQVSAHDLIEVYLAKDLNEDTEIYGVIGGNTSYSMSPYIHNAAFKFHGRNAVFVPLQVRNLNEFMRRMVKRETCEIGLNFRGFAVTIPHKQNIISHLDAMDETARRIGAVNTVKIEDGKLSGFNTDARGFIEPLLNVYGDLKNARAAVVGAGGAARSAVYALKKSGADVAVFARNPKKAENLAEEFQVELREIQKTEARNSKKVFENFDILVNTTPLGTKGELENETVATAEQLESVKLVYDLIYNPLETRLLREAEKANVRKIGGLEMLLAQAREQQKIWTETDAPRAEMRRAALEKLR
jgi:shikimate 5-dehydrogenase